MKRFSSLIILITLSAALISAAVFFKSSSSVTQILWNLSNNGSNLFPLITVSAIIDSINPCAFSILLITIGFLLSLNASKKKILSIGGAYIGGIFLVYLLIGLGILQVLHLFNTPHFMAKIGASALIIFGAINLINEYFPAFPIKLKIPNAAHAKIADLMETALLPAALGLGILVGLCEFPCTGGPYLTAIGLLHDSATFLKGFGYLIIYNILFILPLVLILSIAGNNATLSKIQQWKSQNLKRVKIWIGFIMVALGIIIFLM